MANDKDLPPSVVPDWIDQLELSGYANGQRDSPARAALDPFEACWPPSSIAVPTSFFVRIKTEYETRSDPERPFINICLTRADAFAIYCALRKPAQE
jgi:hypothetical protein